MPEPMLVVEDHDVLGKTRAIPNLLPCRVHHTGPVDPVSEYWDPTQSEDSTSVAYFRGRKLKGRTVALPDNFKGVVSTTERVPTPWKLKLFKSLLGSNRCWGFDEWLQVAAKIHSFSERDEAGVPHDKRKQGGV
ncbi:hypothetical protein G6O67_005682 [Ophiocordyceps sinensis]|uniref:Uncharacterized protein n=1 Tax=Ophiocordyceps sinensis TaxID=72228 RepID=A0A8H4LWQ9_9HYPO|nr:hypothetical protein G6O67_005682 [Ophiocordyceps sinensis]